MAAGGGAVGEHAFVEDGLELRAGEVDGGSVGGGAGANDGYLGVRDGGHFGSEGGGGGEAGGVGG